MTRTIRCPPASPIAVVVLVSCATSLAQPSAVDAGAPPASADPCLRYVPDDYWFVASVDVRAVAPLLTGPQAMANPQYAEFMEAMRQMQVMTGIDMLEDVERCLIVASGPIGDGSAWGIAAEGSFDNRTVKNALVTVGDAERVQHGRHELLRLEGEASVGFPADATIVAGDDRLVRQALDRAGGIARPMPVALQRVLERTPADSVVWAATRPEAVLAMDELAAWRAGHADLAAAVGSLGCVSTVFRIGDDGLTANLLGYAGAEGDARAVDRTLDDCKSRLLQEQGANVFLAAFLLLSDVDADGPFVEASFRLTEPALQTLWNTRFVERR